MKIDIVEGVEEFDRLARSWETAYEFDPEAHIFLSWTWFSIYLQNFPSAWLILAARPDAASDYVAFLPVKRVTKPKDNGEFFDEVWMAGIPRADYTGFLCRPEYEHEALPAFADCLKRMQWAKLDFEFVRASERRTRLFLKPFSSGRYTVSTTEHIIKDVNSNICPYVRLPGGWDAYLNEGVSANTRQKAKRFLKKVDSAAELRVIHSDSATFERDLDTLLRLWEHKWRPYYGPKAAESVSGYRKMLPALFEAGMLVLPVLWQGDKPVGALALLKDEKKRYLGYLIAGRDESFTSPPPGFILHMHSIRWATQHGYETYDFLLGNHPFKYMFGSEENRVRSIYVTHKGKLRPQDQLDRRSFPHALQKAKERQDAGKLTEAEPAYRQILAIDPSNRDALFLLARLKEMQGDLVEAGSLLRQLLALEPGNTEAWLRLGKGLQILGDNTGAAQSYRKVLQFDPQNPDAPSLLAQTSPQHDLLRQVTSKMPSWIPE